MQLSKLRPSLRQVVSVIFFLFATITTVVIGVLWTQSAWNRELQTVHDQHLQLANHLAEALSRYAEDAEAVFQLAVANLAPHQPVRDLGALLDRLHFKHICIVNERGDVEQVISPNADLHIERVSEALLHKLRTSDSATPFSNVLPDRSGKPTLFLWHEINPRQYALGALKTTYFIQLQKAIIVVCK